MSNGNEIETINDQALDHLEEKTNINITPTSQQFDKLLKMQEIETNIRQEQLKTNIKSSRYFHIRENQKVKQQPELKRYSYIFLSFLAFLTTSVMIIAMLADKEAVAMQIIQAIIVFIGGGAGGYALGKSQSKESEKPNNF